MQAELRRLEEQLARALEGEAWHGPSVLEAIEGVSAEQAAARPIAGAHSIWELVLHLCGTYDLVLRRLGGDGRQLAEPEDWPSVPEPSAENWSDAISMLKQLNDDLRQAVRNFPEERLDQPLIPEASYTAYTQFIGVTPHNLYHAGQIALLKKALVSDGLQRVGGWSGLKKRITRTPTVRFAFRPGRGMQVVRWNVHIQAEANINGYAP
jgi:uncharacterized damage-inducible protein DinB